MSNTSHNLEEFLFEAALGKPSPAERDAFLDDACRGNPALRARLDVLLEGHFAAEGFLTRPAEYAPLPPPDATRTETIPSAASRKGATRQIGRYKLLERLGEGGMGEVWMAEQEKPVRRRVALKLIKVGMDTHTVIARFEAEGQALALMDHPNIARVFDVGTTDHGRPYLVMELVRGIKITDYCDQHRLSTRERLDLFIQVCQAIQHAHQKGVIHRDLKPSNILITVNDGAPVPKVIDFGIAKAVSQKLTDKTLFTEFQALIGTPAYMSPEQADLSSVDIDTRADIYSLGVLLYELLVGQTPFDAREMMSEGFDVLRRTIREKEPVRPSNRLRTLPGVELTTTAQRRQTDGIKLTHQLRGDLDWIVMKCLEKDRARRYETANGLAADIKRHLANEPVVARPPSVAYKFHSFARRHKLAFGVGVTIATVLITATMISTWQSVRATRAEALARERLTESEAITRFLTGVFQSPDPARDGRTVTVAETLGAAVTNLDRDLSTQSARRAQLQAALGSTYNALGLPREAVPLREKVRDYYRDAFGPEHPDTLQAMYNLAGSYSGAGRREESMKLAEQVRSGRAKVLGREHPDTLQAMNMLALAYVNAGRLDEAVKLHEEVLMLCRKVNGLEDPQTVAAISGLAIACFNIGRTDDGIRLSNEALRLQRKVDGPEHPNTLRAMQVLGFAQAAAERTDEAIKMYEELLPLQRKVLGPEHPETLRTMNFQTLASSKTGRTNETLRMAAEVLALHRRVLGSEHPDTIWALHAQAVACASVKRFEEAVKLSEEVLRLRRKVNGPRHGHTIQSMSHLAVAYRQTGRMDESIRQLEEVGSLLRDVSGPEHLETLKTMRYLEEAYGEVGRDGDALKLREETYALDRKVLGPEHVETIKVMHHLGDSYAGSGRIAEAVKLWEEVLALRRKVMGPEHPDTLWTMRVLGARYAEVGRHGDAVKIYEVALPILRKTHGPGSSYALRAMTGLAESCRQVDRVDEAVRLGQESTEGYRRLKGPTHKDTLNAMTQWAMSHRAARQLDEAIALEEESLRLKRQHLAAGHSLTIESIDHLATCYEQANRKSEAGALRRELTAIKAAAAERKASSQQPSGTPAQP